eukprot:CAMPEP_0115886018 /NCGR_PEP_ID=MMETSP0287-20121206/30984_1 /TAXON_ID=412157 /ORGANISM="Chrysochromulina rotalis, Strain UIO044" /LENGTH=123 /DNA_ID=CAMNT_0003342475 /DNA_START=233 /DNA_END=605 /DNA_ORIENTATION=-
MAVNRQCVPPPAIVGVHGSRVCWLWRTDQQMSSQELAVWTAALLLHSHLFALDHEVERDGNPNPPECNVERPPRSEAESQVESSLYLAHFSIAGLLAHRGDGQRGAWARGTQQARSEGRVATE